MIGQFINRCIASCVLAFSASAMAQATSNIRLNDTDCNIPEILAHKEFESRFDHSSDTSLTPAQIQIEAEPVLKEVKSATICC